MKPFTRLRAVMLDWAGTTVDHGSIAPVIVLQELFARRRVTLSSEEARRDMGLLKRDHIRAILALPSVCEKWRAAAGRDPVPEDIDSLFADFNLLQPGILSSHSQLIYGVVETTAAWRAQGLRIGSSTGYTREMLTPIAELAAARGYEPDASVCPDEVGAGRPAPWMLHRNMRILDIYPPSACVKIGDTVSDIEEGRNAGMWTIGLTRTGNLVGLDAATWAHLDTASQQSRLASAAQQLLQAGTNYVAEDLSACTPLLEQIDEINSYLPCTPKVR
ncbi:phosphonoacetaldehyde hydrolase [Silvibacterium bohemicum]|uniref:Phosphonoacetaldehyde hydrolase n=1 Tax=Silvibacterium bohemicum TaxID=1577686 RepID=A0A841JNF9_9BACT|nr:phosphonoacetaldehyde hydrolase [Silvibacterium bohemicum]MBB6142680.1 phosphonoacetaldehyde hydrolase [Silvibacterium bohemicum]